jgi:peroxiredoxin
MSSRSRAYGTSTTRPARSHAGVADARTRSGAKRSLPRRFVRKRRLSSTAKAALTIAVAVAVLGGIFVVSNLGGSPVGGDAYAYEVADPGPGTAAPLLRLAATDGSTFDLAAQRGKTVLLFFQEGLGCQACWDQINAIEADPESFRSLGIDVVVSVTSNPLDLLKQKVADDRITTPVLADPDLAASETYGANQYGMMGTTANGHSFVVVGPDGVIRWRADYGGPPNYTMYVPIDRLLADLRAGLNIRDGDQ